jgi:hypothetical protein
MNLKRLPFCAVGHHPEPMCQQIELAQRLTILAPMTEPAGGKHLVENDTVSFSNKVLWVIDQVNHPFVGECWRPNIDLCEKIRETRCSQRPREIGWRCTLITEVSLGRDKSCACLG